jgi:hypothetical protein
MDFYFNLKGLLVNVDTCNVYICFKYKKIHEFKLMNLNHKDKSKLLLLWFDYDSIIN